MSKLITVKDVEQAAKGSKKIVLQPGSMITPLAKDRAKELKVEFIEARQTALNQVPDNQLQDAQQLRIAIGADHGGYYLKEELKKFLLEKKYDVIDMGTHGPEACDYPDFAFKVAEQVASGKAKRGIMIDSVGIGSAMAANRVPGILAAKCNNVVEAKSAREHNYANVLTLGAKIIGSNMAREIVLAFLNTPGGAERHQRRIRKILDYKSKIK
ncbi:MAG: ribose 5-phosphate isomerase B [Caldisericaceae bacterium]|nr:ribose 5-phosphate isomerase B [Caldisericaceae bacterium]